MPERISSILRQATRKDNEVLNILTACTHESYETNIAKTGHNFYAWRTLDGTIKDWNSNYRKLPANYHLLNPSLGNYQIPEYVEIDLVFSQNKFGQIQILKQVADTLQLPLVSLEHTLPMTEWGSLELDQIKGMKGQVNVFISEFSRKAWGWQDNEANVVHHGIDTEVFKPNNNIDKKRHILAVVNDWIVRDYFCGYEIWKRVTEGLPVHVLGNTPGLSEAAKSIDDLVYHHNSSQIFINTSTISPIPMALLEAMSSGCACISTATCMIPEIIKNGENGYITNDEVEMRKILKMLLDSPAECARVGVNARQTILDRFSLDVFIQNWNKVFYQAAEINTMRIP
jgi:hypothetical protein